MSLLTTIAGSAFEWTWKNSLLVSPLILLVFLIQKLLGKRLTADLRYALSLLVLVGLLLPAIPPSPFSLRNLFPGRLAFEKRTPASLSSAETFGSVPENVGPSLELRDRGDRMEFSLDPAAGLIWLSGFACLAGIACWRYLKWRGLVKRGRAITEPSTVDLLERAKLCMGVRCAVVLMAMDRLSSPAVFGVRRVHLVLPETVLRQLSAAELRLVFMHELAHVRRHDVVMNWVLMAVQFLHWFNPLVWWGLHRLRVERELVCDAMVLERAGVGERSGYGHVLLKLLEDYSAEPKVFSSAVPVVSSQREIKGRILMIKNYRKASLAGRVGTGVLLVALACTTLTRARQGEAEPRGGAPVSGSLVVSIDAAGNLRLDGEKKPVSIEQLKAELLSKAGSRPDLALRVDQHVPWSRVVKVMDVARDCKISGISRQIEKEPSLVHTEGSGESAAAPGNQQGVLWSTNLITATNGVSVRYGQAVLSADSVAVNPATGEALAAGHVRIQQGEQLWVFGSQTQFVKVAQNDNGALGFDWYLGNVLMGNKISFDFKTHQKDEERYITKVQIQYVGPHLVSETLIQTNIHVKLGDPLDSSAVDNDVRNLYATGLFYNIRVANERNQQGISLCYIVQCNPRLSGIKFKGNSKFSDAELSKHIGSKVGEMFTERKLFTDSQTIQGMYEKAGYQGAVVKYASEMNKEAGEVQVTFAITETR